MERFSQNYEQDILKAYFNNRKINCLSVGENNGTFLSNVRQFILDGGGGCLVEPAPQAFKELCELYTDREDVDCVNFAIADFVGKTKFFDSGTHLHKGDSSLLSTMLLDEYRKWEPTTSFKAIEVDVIDFASLLKLTSYTTFPLISIDCEGMDLVALKQMDLGELKCEAICVEHNSKPEVLQEIIEYCCKFGLTKELLRNLENIILAL